MGTLRLDKLFRAALLFITVLLAIFQYIYPSTVLGILTGLAVLHVIIIEAFPLIISFLPVTFSRAATLFRVTLIDIYSLILAHCTFLFSQSRYNPACDEGGEPIVFIHGYLTTSGLWFYFRKKCKAAGMNNLFFIDLGAPFASIQDHAETLKRELKKVVQKTGKRHVKLVGHSMGGLVAAYYIAHLSDSERVAVTDFVSLGAPMEGTPWGGLGIGVSSRQMTTKSEFLSSLKNDFTKKSVSSLYLESTADWVVEPLDPSFIHAQNNSKVVQFDDLGHAMFVFSDSAIKVVIEFLSP